MPKVFKAIASLAYHTSFGYSEMYSGMPVYVRNAMARNINDFKKEEKRKTEQNRSTGSSQSGDIRKAAKKASSSSNFDNAAKKVQRSPGNSGASSAPSGVPDSSDLKSLMDKLSSAS